MSKWLLKVLGICFCVFVSIFLCTTYLQAATPTYIQLEFSDIDYDEAQYIKFKIAAYEDIKIVLYMKDNDNNTFYITYQTDNENTGDYDKDDNDELIIYLDEDEYVSDDAEIFDSFDHSNSMSFDEYINNEWKKHNYNDGSAELEKIRIYGDFFWLYYIAVDDGDFTDPTWEIDVSDGRWDSRSDFTDDGHTYSSTTSVYTGGKYPDFISVERTEAPTTASVYHSGLYNGYIGYGYPGTFYGGYTGYGYPGSSYGPGYGFYHGNPYNPNDPLYGTAAPPPISIPSGIMNMLLYSPYDASDAYIPDLGSVLSLPYLQAATRSGWTPWNFPSGFQPYYGYGGYPSISPNWPPIGMAYDNLSRSFYIPGQNYYGGYPWRY